MAVRIWKFRLDSVIFEFRSQTVQIETIVICWQWDQNDRDKNKLQPLTIKWLGEPIVKHVEKIPIGLI